jgi:hypothetical protein
MGAGAVMAVEFVAAVRQWREDKPGGLAVVDVPADLVGALGGRRQYRVTGTINGAQFAGSTMLVAGGGFCVGVARAVLRAAHAAVGDEVTMTLQPADQVS